MTTKFLVDLDNFNGGCLSTVHNGFVDFSGQLYNKGGENLTVAQYLAHPKAGAKTKNPAVVSWDAMIELTEEWERETYLDKPPVEISEAAFYEAMEAVPPMNWKNTPFENFLMGEFITGNITNQYAWCGNRFLRKCVDVTKPDTYITMDHFIALPSLKESV